jgi:hypothetical protein
MSEVTADTASNFGREREREREKKVGGVVRDTTLWRGGNRNIIWQFGRFPGPLALLVKDFFLILKILERL